MITREFVRFLLVGACNTLVAYGSYLLLVRWLPYPVAWGIAYLTGIGSGYVANALLVFKRTLQRRSALAFLCIYLVQYLVNLLLLKITLDVLNLPHWLAALVAIGVTLLPTFLLVRFAMGRGAAEA